MPLWMWVTLSVIAYGGIWRFAFRWMWEIEPVKSWSNFWAYVFLATFFFWLVMIVAPFQYIIRRSSPDRVARLITGESRAAKRKRQKRELDEREQRIAQAERELGIE